MNGVFLHSFSVPDSAIDINRHVNNLEYLRWMQDVATAHSSACGWPMERYLQHRCSWVIRSHYIEYLRPCFAGEDITLATWVSELGDTSSPRHYVFLRAQDRQILAQARTDWVFVNIRSGRPQAILESVRQDFIPVPEMQTVLDWLQTPESILS